jgi:hypothetical protein
VWKIAEKLLGAICCLPRKIPIAKEGGATVVTAVTQAKGSQADNKLGPNRPMLHAGD